MAELDFSKIFGETATSKASFTDENYLNGWGYLGSTPPPYQLFDYLQSINDKKSKYLYDKVNENGNNLSIHNTNATAHADIRAKITSDINSHNTNVDAHSPILNAIKAISGMSAYDIAPSKTIASMIPLLGFGGIVAQLLEDNGYVKFANGLTFQWGKIQDNTTSSMTTNRFKTITLPIAFVNNWYVVLTTQISLQTVVSEVLDTECAVRLGNKNVNQFTIQIDDYSAGAYWLCVGV